jgi:hypothetical protein
VVRVLVLRLGGNQRWTRAAKVKKVLFAEKRKERPHVVMQWNWKAVVPWVTGWKSGFIAFFF